MSFFFEISAPALKAVQGDHLYAAHNTIPCLLGSASSLQLYVPVDKVEINKHIARSNHKRFFLYLPQSPKEVRIDVWHYCTAALLQKPHVSIDPPF